VLSKLNAMGKLCVYASVATDVIIDVAGFFPERAGAIALLQPLRVFDSRNDAVTVGSNFEVGLRSGTDSYYADESIALNVTAVDPTADGFLTVYPCGEPIPEASNLNFIQGKTVANAVLARVGTGGNVCIYSSAPTSLIVDLVSRFE
jgi:hypothetical protein